MKNLQKTSGFTLIEMLVATTIFAVMSIAVMSIYIQTTSLSNRLKATRYLSETSREITERIAEDVKWKGISQKYSRYDDGTLGNDMWRNPSYQSGWELLTIGSETSTLRSYFYGKKIGATLSLCTEGEKKDTTTECWLYVMPSSIFALTDTLNPDFSQAFNLVDSFIPEESKKRVKIEDMKFYISGDGNTTEKKVTIVFTLALMPRIWVPLIGLSESKLRVQTTISERFFKQN